MTRLAAGDVAPEFTLSDDRGEQVSLSDFRDSLESLTNAGYSVVGLSPDDPEKLTEFRKKENLSFPLLSDPDKRVLDAYGTWGEKTSYGKKVIGVIRSTFVIDPDGKVEKAMYNVKATGHVARLREELVH